MSIKSTASGAWAALRRSLGKVKRVPGKVLDRIENVEKIKQEKNRQMQHDLDVRMRPREKDSSYLDMDKMDKPKPFPTPSAMKVGRRIVKF